MSELDRTRRNRGFFCLIEKWVVFKLVDDEKFRTARRRQNDKGWITSSRKKQAGKSSSSYMIRSGESKSHDIQSCRLFFNDNVAVTCNRCLRRSCARLRNFHRNCAETRSSIHRDLKIKKNHGEYIATTLDHEHYTIDLRIYAESRVAMSQIFTIWGHSAIKWA